MQLLEHFKELTLHPKNAQELKGLILQLAVQGNLTKKWREQNSDVEHASLFFQRIKEEKERLIKVKILKKETDILEIDENEISFYTPKSWKWVRLGEVMSIIRGVTFKKSEISEVETNGSIGVLRGQNMNNSKINKQNLIYLSREQVKDEQIIKKGDIAITLSSGSDHLVGKIGLSDYDEEFTIGAFYGKLLIFESSLKFYLLNYLDSPLYKNQLRGAFRGIGINNLSNEKVKNLYFPLPPFEEQKAIVEVVNQLFAEVEQLETLTKERIQLKADFVTSALNQLTQAAEQDTASQWAFLQQHFNTFFTEKENIKKLREGILQLAVQGKLTRDWRAIRQAQGTLVEPASTLLEKIKAEKEQLIKAGKIKKEKPLPEISDEEIPYELPEGWVWCRLGDITTIKGGKRLPKGHILTLENTGRVYIRVTDMKNGSIDDSNLHFISEEVFEQISNYIIEKEDLYLTIVGATIGKLGLVPEKFHRMNLTENAARIIKYQIDKELLYYFMVSYFVQNQFFDKTNQVGVPKLALHRVAKTLLPLPPLAEQNVIVQKVNALMGFCDRLEKEIEQNTQQLENLIKSCLREVFEN